MRIGFDIDGVLANFQSPYQDLFISTTGRNMFLAGDRNDPPTWDWPMLRGYTDEETAEVWRIIKTSEDFWLKLQPYHGLPTLRTVIKDLERQHEIYFITDRAGVRPKRQTEIWLFDHLGYSSGGLSSVWPTVLLVKRGLKGAVAKGLNLDIYLDDNLDNAKDIGTTSPTTQSYLLTRPYNAHEATGPFIRVNSLGEMLDREIQLAHI